MGSRGRPRGSGPSTGPAADPAATDPAAAVPAAAVPADGGADPGLASGDASSGGPASGRGRADRRRTARRARRSRRRSLLREIPLVLVVALGLALLLQTFVVQVFSIPSGSMQQTIGIGDRVAVDKFSPWFGWHPQRGDVIVFKDPDDWLKDDPAPHSGPVLGAVKSALTFVGLLPSDRDLIKRVIGLPGDTVACCDSHGRVTVNGVAIDESGYLFPGNPPSRTPFKVTVPPGKLWVMGDHRDVSADSRVHLDEPSHGFVPESDVVGKAVAVVWPVPRWRSLDPSGAEAHVPAPGSTPGGPANTPGGAANTPQSLGQVSAPEPTAPRPAELSLVVGVAATAVRRRRNASR